MRSTKKPAKITRLVMMGDSLSDRRTFYNRYLGPIPLRWIVDFAGKSPLGRFTNGNVWADDISARFVEQFIIEEAESEKAHRPPIINSADIADGILTKDPHVRDHLHDAGLKAVHIKRRLHHAHKARTIAKLDDTDIADAVIDNDPKIASHVLNDYDLSNDKEVRYHGQTFVRSYDEGGLSAKNYRGKPSTSIVRFFTRLIISNLDMMRKKLFDYDHAHLVTPKQKKETLVIEWSGANDFMTANERPSPSIVNDTLRARLANAEKLIKHGYKHFILFDLPDLSLTPRFHNASEEEKQNLRECVRSFNTKLQKGCDALAKKYKNCSFKVHQISKKFAEVCADPGKYGFDPEKIHTPYIESKDFKNNNKISPAPGYLFWDKVHPTREMHALLAEDVYEMYCQKYHFSAPELDESPKGLCNLFKEAYKELFINDSQRVLGFYALFARSRLPVNFDKLAQEDNEELYREALVKIIQHGLANHSSRTFQVMKEIGWIDSRGEINTASPVSFLFEGPRAAPASLL